MSLVKRVFSIFIALLILFAECVFVVNAQTIDATISISAPTEAVKVGDEIAVPIIISDRMGLMGAQFQVQWDPTLLTMSDAYNEDDDIYTGYTDKPTLFNKVFSINVNDVANGSVTVGGIRASVFTSSQAEYLLGTLHFTVNEAAAGKTVELSFVQDKTYAHNGSGDADFSVLNGASFTVEKNIKTSNCEISLTPPQNKVYAGDTIDIPVVISDRAGLMGAQFKVTWDPTLLTMSDAYNEDDDIYEGYTDKPTLFNKVFSANVTDVDNGSLTIGGIRASAFTSSQENYSLGTLHFTVNEAAVGKTVEIAFDADKTYVHDGEDDATFSKLNGISFDVLKEEKIYAVTFKNDDGSILDTVSVVEGGTAVYAGEIPTKESTAQYNYEFTGWNTSLENITADTTITAVYESILRSYTVQFVSDGVVISEQTVNYGEGATAPNNPVKEGNAQYTYAFTGWDKEFDNITGDLVVNAIFDEITNTYDVCFEDADGNILELYESVYGAQIGRLPIAPEIKGYEFIGYYDDGVEITEFTVVTADIIAVATYSKIPVYTVTFKNEDGSILDTVSVLEGGTAVYGGELPAKESTAQYNYEFIGWDASLENIIADTTIIATYTEILRSYTVQFVSSGVVISEQTVNYGESAVTPEDPVKERDAQYTYIFAGWDESFYYITGDLVVNAVFYEMTNTYSVYFKDVDGNIFETYESEYGAQIGSLPIAPEINGCEFVGYYEDDVEITESTVVTGDIIAVAIYQTIRVGGIELDNAVVEIKVGEDVTLTATVIPENASNKNVVWTSSDKNIATVVDGVVTAVSKGETTITVTTEDCRYSATCIVIVIDSIVASGICGDNLTWVLTDDGVLTIDGTGDMYDYLYNYSNPAPWASYKDSINEIVISPGVTYIGGDAFYYCTNLKSISIPDSITTIGSNAFAFCSGVNVYVSIEEWCNIRFVNDSSNPLYNGYLYVDGELATEIIIPETVKAVKDWVFYYNKSITSVVIPNTVTTIGSGAFGGCSGLTTISIPDSVVSIGSNAFANCSNLESISISSSVASINSMAFFNCTSLETVYYDGSEDDWEKISISSYNESLTGANIIYGINKYTVTFKNYDGSVLYEADVVEGETAVYSGKAPVRESTAQYNYEFTGWNKSLENITSDIVVTAVYKSMLRSYTVQFVSDGAVISEQTVNYGEAAIEPTAPTKESTAQYTYTFIGWDGSFDAITGDTVIDAVFGKNLVYYTVKFVDIAGNVIETYNIGYGNRITTLPDAPQIECYNFEGYYKDGTQVTANTIVKGAIIAQAVYSPVLVERVTLNKTELVMEEGGIEALVAAVMPENALNKNVVWTSSDETVATVEDGIIMALDSGEVTITVTTFDGNYTASCVVTVEALTDYEIIVEDGVVNVKKNCDNEGETIIIAIYGSDGTMKSVQLKETDLGKYESVGYTYNKSDNDIVKVFIWKSISEMIPR